VKILTIDALIALFKAEMIVLFRQEIPGVFSFKHYRSAERAASRFYRVGSFSDISRFDVFHLYAVSCVVKISIPFKEVFKALRAQGLCLAKSVHRDSHAVFVHAANSVSASAESARLDRRDTGLVSHQVSAIGDLLLLNSLRSSLSLADLLLGYALRIDIARYLDSS